VSTGLAVHLVLYPKFQVTCFSSWIAYS